MNIFKYLLITCLLTLSLSTYATCGNNSVMIKVLLSSSTADNSYDIGSSDLKNKDSVEVFEILSNKTFLLTEGNVSDDGAGNYQIEASNTNGQEIDLFHDHETWHFEGLQGTYKTSYNEIIDLSDIKCDYDDLFKLF